MALRRATPWRSAEHRLQAPSDPLIALTTWRRPRTSFPSFLHLYQRPLILTFCQCLNSVIPDARSATRNDGRYKSHEFGRLVLLAPSHCDDASI